MTLTMLLTCKFTNASKKMELMFVVMNYKITIKHSEEKKSHEIQMCLSLKGIANHLGQRRPCISLYGLPMGILFTNPFLPMWEWTNIG
jgi:hypothetical protein